MSEIIHTHDTDTSGPGAALGIVLGVLLVLALLAAAWWFFFRQPVAVQTPNTTIIEENQQPPQGDTNIQQNQDTSTAP